MHWYEIQFFKDRGFRIFDFGRINPAPLHQHTPLHYLKCLLEAISSNITIYGFRLRKRYGHLTVGIFGYRTSWTPHLYSVYENSGIDD